MNMFLILYPIGVIGECLTTWESWDILVEERPYRLEMPNIYNFAFDPIYFHGAFFVICPLGMLFIYSTLLAARSKYMSGSTKKKVKSD
mmetsp:Transcript_8667/g.8189  ORF Transcript_8667/g.8189 Transcript_8667/m.8189 type:complete len:88 (+) Transcript_8667:421-684(+)